MLLQFMKKEMLVEIKYIIFIIIISNWKWLIKNLKKFENRKKK